MVVMEDNAASELLAYLETPSTELQRDVNEASVRQEVRLLSLRNHPWNAARWLQLREDIWKAGHLHLLPLILGSVEKTTQQTLETNSYSIDGRGVVDLTQKRVVRPVVRWFNRDNVRAPSPAPQSIMQVPLSFVAAEELDVALACARQSQRPVTLSIETSLFSDDGSRIEWKPGIKTMESGLFLRSDVRGLMEQMNRISCSRGQHAPI